jgi:lysophospholipase L1-like esterase
MSVHVCSGCQLEKAVDELNLSNKIISRYPSNQSNLPLPDHLHRFVALNRSPSRLEFSETLLGIHTTFDGAMILFENVVQVLHRSVSTAVAQRSFLLSYQGSRKCKSVPGQC